ncbi:MAG: YggS family pyridoxal phosphate-dependent enzyme [Oscillospiraceae bacterium]|nr:YggS family pyridoxal phosphate-dependent enzyme [Oscillospiraceae bacterium]
METDFSYIDENYRKIIFNMQEAAAKYRKPEEKISLMAVTKTVDPAAVNHAIGLGINLLGENRVQEYTAKKDFYDKSAEVHFIGHLQTNKVKYIIDSVSMIQSVDSIKLAEEINRHAGRIGKKQDILMEVNIGGEESKSGVDKSALEELLYQTAELENVQVRGLMAIPPADSPEKFLYDMQKLYIDISGKSIHNISMDFLSMGMSGDYADAIKYGSNIIRIGRGLFGPRNYA